MKKLHKYEVILDDGKDVFKAYIPAFSRKEVETQVSGNGEIVRIKEVSDYLPSASRVSDDLCRCGYGKAECEFVYRILSMYVDGCEE